MSDIIIEVLPPDEITVTIGKTVPWSDVTDKPTSFTPSAHASTHLPAGPDPIVGLVTEAPIDGIPYGREDGAWTPITATIPIGMITPYGGSSAPTGWSLCDGGGLDTTTEAGLFAVIGYTYGGSGGSFNKPDMRAAAPVGAGTSTGYTQNETIALGEKLNDQMHGHWHIVKASSSANQILGAATISGTFADRYEMATVSGTISGSELIGKDIVTNGTNGTPRVGNVTRGKVVGVNYIIKL